MFKIPKRNVIKGIIFDHNKIGFFCVVNQGKCDFIRRDLSQL